MGLLKFDYSVVQCPAIIECGGAVFGGNRKVEKRYSFHKYLMYIGGEESDS